MAFFLPKTRTLCLYKDTHYLFFLRVERENFHTDQVCRIFKSSGLLGNMSNNSEVLGQVIDIGPKRQLQILKIDARLTNYWLIVLRQPWWSEWSSLDYILIWYVKADGLLSGKSDYCAEVVSRWMQLYRKRRYLNSSLWPGSFRRGSYFGNDSSFKLSRFESISYLSCPESQCLKYFMGWDIHCALLVFWNKAVTYLVHIAYALLHTILCTENICHLPEISVTFIPIFRDNNAENLLIFMQTEFRWTVVSTTIHLVPKLFAHISIMLVKIILSTKQCTDWF